MYVTLRRAMIRVLLPFSWWARRRRPAETLAQFAETEADSGWQFLRAFGECDSAVHRAHLFHNLLEESEHASLFTELVNKRNGLVPPPEDGRHSLLDQEGELAAFLAYVQAGELDIAQEFEAYAKAVPDEDVRTVFQHIMTEEDGHQSSLWLALLDVTGSESKAHQLVGRARRRRAWRAFLRFSKRLGDSLLGLWLTIVYVVAGPFCVLQGRRRLAAPAASK